MPIRFRCAYCNQLMSIARRKAGTVVRCPKCDKELTVPKPVDEDSPAPADKPEPAEKPRPAAQAFEASDFSNLLEKPAPPPLVPAAPGSIEYDVEPIALPEPRGVVLPPLLVVVVGILMVMLLGLAFFLGMLVGQQREAPPSPAEQQEPE